MAEILTSIHGRLIGLDKDGYLTGKGAIDLPAAGPARLQTYTVATVPAAADWTGSLIYVSNGAGGSPAVAFSDGTNWLRVEDRLPIAAA